MTTMTQTRTLVGIDEHGHGVVYKEPTPALQPGEVLVRVTATMISPGTQLSGIAAVRRGEAERKPHGRPLGYQAAGVVEHVGKNVSRLQPGQRVACFGPGALHTNYAIVPQMLCAPIPDGVSDEAASGMNLVLTAMQALRRTPSQLGEFLLVVGLGTVGQLVAQFGRTSGLYVMGWDMTEGRRDIAQTFCADDIADPRDSGIEQRCRDFTRGLGFDAAVLAIGGNGTPALQQVKSVMKLTPDGHHMGQLTMVGGLITESQWGAGMGNLDLHSSARSGPGYHDRAWELGEVEYPPVFVRWTTQTNMQLALRMLEDKRLAVEPLISHRLPLSDIDRGIELLTEQPDQTLGVVLIPDAD